MRRPSLLCSILLPLLCGATAVGAAPAYLTPVAFGSGALEDSNGDKMVTGPFNTLHAVYQYAYQIYYVTSADGVAWTAPQVLSPGGQSARSPAIATDGQGRIGVVWVADPGANGLGSLYYAFRTAGNPLWQVSQLASSARQPALVGRGSLMYVTWSAGASVKYLSFPSSAPPAFPPGSVETLASSACPATSYHLPSITLVASPCKPAVPRIAALYAADEQATAGICHSASTVVGPLLWQRNNPNPAWSLLYNGTRTNSAPASAVEAIALSLSANFSTGDTFLAWSDEQTGSARTMLVHGHGSIWDASPFDASRHHVHVRANPTSVPTTRFRFAWTGGGFSYDEFFSYDTFYDTATWTGASPTWSGAVQLTGAGGFTGRPQAVLWKRCAAGQLATTDAYYIAEEPCTNSAAYVEANVTSPCPPTSPILAAQPCKQKALLAVASLPVGGVLGTTIDTAELGVVTKAGDSSAQITTADGKVVTISWSRGRLVSSSDFGFVVTAPRADIRFASPDLEFDVKDYGTLREYEPAKIAKAAAKCM